MSMRLPSLLVGTRNPGKVREIETILGDVPWRIRSLQEFSELDVPAETGETYADNAIIKARFYARATGICALADDSGLEVEALDGAPGVFSARYAGGGASDADRRTLLLSQLAEVPTDQRHARFVCAVAIATPAGPVLNISEGTCEGDHRRRDDVPLSRQLARSVRATVRAPPVALHHGARERVDPGQRGLFDEMTTFPFGEHDDLLDATATGTAFLLDRREPRVW